MPLVIDSTSPVPTPTSVGDSVTDDTVVVPQRPFKAFSFRTPTVLLEADAIWIRANGKTFSPRHDVQVGGDPGTPNEYTTLELTWTEHGVEMRLFLYLVSNGTTWWTDSIGISNGEPSGDWQEPRITGPFHLTPLGAATSGTLDLGNLTIEGMHLQAFTPATECEEPDGGEALIADYPSISVDGPGGFGASFQVLDSETCTPLPVADFQFRVRSSDESVVRVAEQEAVVPVKQRLGLVMADDGSATLSVELWSADGELIDTVEMPVRVGEG